MRRAWLLLIVLLAGCATLQALFPPDRPNFVPAEARHISGAHARAITVAYTDWADQLAAFKAESLRIDENEDAGPGVDVIGAEALARIECNSYPEHYQAWVHSGDAGTSYIVTILSNDEFCYGKGNYWPYSGGGAIYEIDARTHEILSKEIQE